MIGALLALTVYLLVFASLWHLIDPHPALKGIAIGLVLVAPFWWALWEFLP